MPELIWTKGREGSVLHAINGLQGYPQGNADPDVLPPCLHLDAPVMRVASIDTPVPFSHALEEQFLPKGRLKETLERLLSY